MAAPLMADPRWALAAQALVDGCIDLRDDEERVALLATICDGLGDELYPAFLRVLWTIGQYGDHAARAALADALVYALRTGRLPSGRRQAWGATGTSSSASSFGSTRCLGPIEYLCAWHVQADPAQALPAAAFEAGVRTLLELIGTSTSARQLYCEKLLADVADPLVGALTRPTRHALGAMATAWSQGASPHEATARFVQALPDASAGSLAARLPPPVRTLR